MSIDSQFIALLREEIDRQRVKSLDIIVSGKLNEKDYGFSCGYLRALDDLTRPRSKDGEPGMIDHILEDMRKD